MQDMQDFKKLHDKKNPLLLPNVWDAASARVIESCGFKAIATSSAGLAWSLGYADGEQLPFEELVAAIGRIVRVVNVPVSADIESGYSHDADTLLENVKAIVGAGAVGINLEDYDLKSGSLFPIETARQRVACVKERFGDSLFVNARTDMYLHQIGRPEARLATTIDRLSAFREAGADGIFVPAVTDAPTIAALAAATDAALNILAGAATPPVDALRELGVARISLGGSLTRIIMGETRAIGQQLLRTGEFSFAANPHAISYAEANELFTRS
ncbi:MAG: isocitrate lyase/phosphoenolpyruvate mutase family protein [Candidatus Baltobacteraceae bacterium]